MGSCVGVKCKCRNKELHLGTGLLYPTLYQKTITGIRNSKYGEEMQQLANATELVTVDVTYKPYRCEKCGHIEAAICLDLYKPNDIESAKRTVVGNWTAFGATISHTVGELGDWPYWIFNENCNKKEGNYIMLKKYEHLCPSCKRKMTELDEKKVKNMRCPKCGEQYGNFRWVWEKNGEKIEMEDLVGIWD